MSTAPKITQPRQSRKEIELAEQLSRERLSYSGERAKWEFERTKLMRVIFQLSEALEWQKHHG